MEEKILRALDSDCQFVSPLPFLRRFLQAYGIKVDETDPGRQQIADLAMEYIYLMQGFSSFLEYRPSQIAAASVLCAINISASSITDSINAVKINETDLRNLIANPAVRDHWFTK